jgi:hypothetical protein
MDNSIALTAYHGDAKVRTDSRFCPHGFDRAGAYCDTCDADALDVLELGGDPETMSDLDMANYVYERRRAIAEEAAADALQTDLDRAMEAVLYV